MGHIVDKTDRTMDCIVIKHLNWAFDSCHSRTVESTGLWLMRSTISTVVSTVEYAIYYNFYNMWIFPYFIW